MIDKKTVERFWKKVNKTDGCWLWTGGKYSSGYGEFWTGSIKDGGKLTGAHRVSWMIHYGEIPEGIEVLHKCDVRTCVRPDHLFLGTQTDNMQDMFRKGRKIQPSMPGSTNPASKLVEGNIIDIRKRYVRGVVTLKELAGEFGVSFGTIGQIVNYKTWKNI